MTTFCRPIWIVALLVPVMWTGASVFAEDEPPDLSTAEIARRGREATAFLDAKSGRWSTAFCIHPSGIFITNDRILEDQSGPLKLVLDSGTIEQSIHVAKIIRHVREADLLLLQIDAGRPLPALTLGPAAALEELRDVFIFGFPFGRDFGVADDLYPSISVKRESISLINRENGRIVRIKLNAAVKLGNLGGPILDNKGQVIGVVGRAKGFIAAETDVGIPAMLLDTFLARPVIDLLSPPSDTVALDEELEFRARIVQIIPEEGEIEAQLVFDRAGPDERRFPMEKVGDLFRIRAVPIPRTDEPEPVAIEASYFDGTISGTTPDRSIRIGDRDFRLSELLDIQLGDNEARNIDGHVIKGRIEAPKDLVVRLGAQEIRIDLDRATKVEMTNSGRNGGVGCNLIVLRDRAEIGRASLPIYRQGFARPNFDAIREGRFITPMRSSAPVNYVKIASDPGEVIGRGKSYTYENPNLNFQLLQPAGMQITFGSALNWRFAISTGMGRSLVPGEFRNAKRWPINDSGPGLLLSGNGQGGITIDGAFRVWEIEMNGNQVTRLAVDFVQRSDGKPPALVGMIRYQSTYY